MKHSFTSGQRLLSGLAILLLAGCGGDSSSTHTIASGSDTTTATASLSPTDTLGIRDTITITFSEAMDPASLSIDGGLGTLSDGGTWSSGNTVLTLAPDPAWNAWESGNQPLTLTVEATAGNATTVDTTLGIDFNVSTFQDAAVVIGQTDFTGTEVNQGSGADAATLNNPYGFTSFIDNILWVADYNNNRVLGFDGIPIANGASASYIVGQWDFSTTTAGTTASSLSGPQTLLAYNGYFYLLEHRNSRILIFDSTPYAAPRTANAVLGQATFTSSDTACTAQGLNSVESMSIADGKLVVTDTGNNRVLIWNTVPTTTGTAPDLVLGQGDFTHCQRNDDNQDGSADATSSARTLNYPAGVWTDGARLVVNDDANNRVLIWNSFPTTSFQSADIVLGQADFTHNTENDDNQDGVAEPNPTNRTLFDPYEGVWSNGRQLFVTDSYNRRVLVWNSFPTANFQPADVVIGQADFEHRMNNDNDQDGTPDATASARTFQYPVGVSLQRDKLLINDNGNHRILVFASN